MREAMVSDPRNMVSCRPRARISRSVNTCPRSKSAASCISSTARKSTVFSIGMLSTVQTHQRGFFGMIFSSPVTSATAFRPAGFCGEFTTRS
ncbi:hypothetical protein CRD36_00880 [Paremcibacter congregatus]|uniref:Uncharacterized protein n=1 Tax=Paremcibacter congregatus TaxID=2043170 RepID=A0A2G4YW37_9PROT|nr:hypothetical protein CRD36_00880 [Paremcibacter congregatus]